MTLTLRPLLQDNSRIKAGNELTELALNVYHLTPAALTRPAIPDKIRAPGEAQLSGSFEERVQDNENRRYLPAGSFCTESPSKCQTVYYLQLITPPPPPHSSFRTFFSSSFSPPCAADARQRPAHTQASSNHKVTMGQISIRCVCFYGFLLQI